MRLWRHAAKDAGVLGDTRCANHGCLWDAIGDALTVSDVHQVAQIIRQLLEKQANKGPVRVSEDAGFKDIRLNVAGLISDCESRLNRVESDDRKGHSAMQVTSVQRGNQLFFQTAPLAPGRQMERTLTL